MSTRLYGNWKVKPGLNIMLCEVNLLSCFFLTASLRGHYHDQDAALAVETWRKRMLPT